MKFCGPKLSVCCLVLSVWGIIQLSIMGGLYYIHSLAFIEDLPLDHNDHSIQNLFDSADRIFGNVANNCWIAAGMYVITLIVSIWQAFLNKEESSVPANPHRPRYSAPPSPVLPGAIGRTEALSPTPGTTTVTITTAGNAGDVIMAETSFSSDVPKTTIKAE